MILIRFASTLRNDTPVMKIRPKNDHQLPLFKHCASGLEAVTESYFNAYVKDVLRRHDVYDLHIEDVDDG